MEQTETAEDFLKIASKFKLGCLLTEQQCPQTVGLSDLAQNHPSKAVDVIKALDIQTIKVLQSKLPELEALYVDVNACLEAGGKIYICGCGATGRLALVLETLWRQETQKSKPDWADRVVAFMAGGDAALIKSVQDFEDHPEFAEQQLLELGFTDKDLLIGSTEGGQTPWVIGAIWKAVQISALKPYILYGNTDQILVVNVERSKQFIECPKINKINCNVGQMALAGSTRMQATTILMHAIGITLLGCDQLRQAQLSWKQYSQANINNLLHYLQQCNLGLFVPLIEEESEIYQNGQKITYVTDDYYAISILTDTTERSPTFSLLPFPNKYTDSEAVNCWCNLKITNQHSAQLEKWNEKVHSDWTAMLAGRQIRALDSAYWKKYEQKVSTKILLGFGLHEMSGHNSLEIKHSQNNEFVFKSNRHLVKFPSYPTRCRLSHHSVMKMLLNNLSTVVMGRMNRYQSNIMTFVKPTNYKLIDRATRYVMMLHPKAKYEQVVRIIYAIKDKIEPDEPIVLKVIEKLKQVQ